MPDPFETLGAPRAFDVDLSALEKRHRDLSSALHPDRYAHAPPDERRRALGKAIEVNDAWRTLRDPTKRAEALLALLGVEAGEGKEPPADPELLMEILELREALGEARQAKDIEAVRRLVPKVRERAAKATGRLGAALDAALAQGGKVPETARAPLLRGLGELRYYRRFLDEAGCIEDEL